LHGEHTNIGTFLRHELVVGFVFYQKNTKNSDRVEFVFQIHLNECGSTSLFYMHKLLKIALKKSVPDFNSSIHNLERPLDVRKPLKKRLLKCFSRFPTSEIMTLVETLNEYIPDFDSFSHDFNAFVWSPFKWFPRFYASHTIFAEIWFGCWIIWLNFIIYVLYEERRYIINSRLLPFGVEVSHFE